MLKNIILEITANKKARNIEPTHALFKEVYSIAKSKGLSIEEVKNGLNELFIAGEIEVGRTINDKYIYLQKASKTVENSMNIVKIQVKSLCAS